MLSQTVTCDLPPLQYSIFKTFTRCRQHLYHQGPVEFSNTRNVLQTLFWKKKSNNNSVVLRAPQSFPVASITNSLKESFLSFISFSWLKSIISSSANLFTLLSRSPAASRNENVSGGSGESRLLRTGTATNTEHKLCPSAFVLAIHLLYCVSSRLYNNDTAPQILHNDYTHSHTHFSPLNVLAVAVSIYLFGWSCVAGIQFNIQSCKSTIKWWGEEVRNCCGLTDPAPFLCLHLCPVTQVHYSPPVFHLVFRASFPHPHSDLYRWMDCYPPTPPPNLPGSLLEFPAAHQSLFSQVIAQGILIKVKIRCWEVTFQTSCDFRCEIKWADFPVSDKHPVMDEGYFKESTLCSDPSLQNYVSPGGSVWFGSPHKHVGFYMWWIWEWRLESSASQMALIEVINGSNWENHVRARTSPDGHYIFLAVWGALRDGLLLDHVDGSRSLPDFQTEPEWTYMCKSPGCNTLRLQREFITGRSSSVVVTRGSGKILSSSVCQLS